MKKIVHEISPESHAATVPETAPAEVAFAATPLGQRLMEALQGGSGSNRRIAEHLLRNPVRASAWSIEELAREVGVSNATLSRFARTAGFDGFADLRSAMAQALQGVLMPVEKLRSTLEQAGPDGAALRAGLETTLANLRRTAEQIDPAALGQVVERLCGTRTTYVMGFGLSAHIAAMLTLGLQPYCPTLINVVEFGGTEVAAGRLMNLGKEDMLIVISFPRYARHAVQLTDFARERGAHVVAITDSPASPLARRADTLLIAESAHPVLSSSLSAGLLLAEALVCAVMLSNRDNIRHARDLTEAISLYLYG